MRRSSLPLLLGLIGCAPPAQRADERPTSPTLSADSLQLRRTRCFGSCPSYVITLTRSGRVAFQSGAVNESTVASASALPYLTARAQAIGFFDLPADIAADSVLCRQRATDMPTAIVTIFAPTSTKTVSDYYGCFPDRDLSTSPRLGKLRAFETQIDSVLGSARWVNGGRSR